MEKPITYVSLDVHKDTIAIALAEADKCRKCASMARSGYAVGAEGTDNEAAGVRGGHELRFCYEAGPCGCRIQRQLSADGHGCVVVAPSPIPRGPREWIKTDRREEINLAKLHRAGELTPVWVP